MISNIAAAVDLKILNSFFFPLMFIKFGTVIMYFMHLKYDNHLFKRVFLFGLILAVVVFLIMLTTMRFWSGQYLEFLHE